MNRYVTGETIKKLREREGMTQSQLADVLMVSNKTISKWENEKGLPDISLIIPLADALKVSVIELLSGNEIKNDNVSANYKRGKWYICPICGNVIHAMGEAVISCCGITLPFAENEDPDQNHEIHVERVDGEYFVSMNHPMTKDHYICFMAYTTDDGVQVKKLYPEGPAEARFAIRGHGTIHAYCNHHGKFSTIS